MKIPLNQFLSLRAIVFAFVLLTGFVQETKATHYAGGDIEYENIGLRKWKIRLTLYRYCDNGAAALCGSMNCTLSMTATPDTTVSNGGLNPTGCSGPSISLTLWLIKVEDAEKKKMDYCGIQSKNACTNLGQVTAGSYRPSVEKYIFEGTLDVSDPTYDNACPYYNLYYSNCCRNTTTNIQGQPSFYYQSIINIHHNSNASGLLKNNSPRLLNEAIITFKAGIEQKINAGAVDLDGDSLSYAIVKSLQGANAPVVYNAPYNEYVPFPLNQALPPHNLYPWAARLVLDTVYGDITLNAKNTGTTPIAGDVSVEITQWAFKIDSITNVRTAFIAGKTMRNLQIYSVPSISSSTHTHEPPRFTSSLSASSGTFKQNYNVLAGKQLCFTITAKDSIIINKVDSTYISWNPGLSRPGKLTFTPDYDTTQPRPREDRWKFCWETDSSDARELPYYFSIVAYDNNCPDPGKVQQGFSIKVNSDMGEIMKSFSCPDWLVQVRKIDMERILDSAKLEVAKLPGDFIFTGGTDVYKATNPNPNGNNPTSIIQQKMQFKQLGKYLLRSTFYYTDTLTHTKIYYDTIDVTHIDSLSVSVDDEAVCINDSVFIVVPKIVGGIHPLTYAWGLVKPIVAFINSDSIFRWPPFSGEYSLKVTDANSCIRNDTFKITIKNLSGILPANGNICTNTPILFKAIVNNPWKNYQSFWKVDTVTSSQHEFTTAFQSPGTKNIKLVVSDSTGCKDSLTTTLNVHNVPTAHIYTSTDTIQCQTANNFKFYTNKQTGVTYTWKLDNITRTDTFFNFVLPVGNKLLTLKVSNQYCSDSSKQSLGVIARPGAVITLQSDSVQCLSDNIFKASTPFKSEVSHIWKYESITRPDSLLSVVFSSSGVKQIWLVKSSWKNCTDSAQIKVRVKDMPTIAQFNSPAGIVYKDTVYQYSVTAQTNNKYHWSGNNVSILSADTSYSVDVRWLATGVGILRLSHALEGCARIDSVAVMVNGYVGLNELSETTLVHVFPNPNNGSFSILLNAQNKGKATVKLYNTLGAEVLSKQTGLEAGVNNLDIQTELANGVYLLNISDGINTTTQRVVISK